MTFSERLMSLQEMPLGPRDIRILQVNVGYRCNMACKHCHIGAGPANMQEMSRETSDVVLRVIAGHNIPTLDITGGAPELNPNFRYLIAEAARSGVHIIVRTNLTVILEKGMEDLADFYSTHGVEVIASLPYYTESEVDRVRGKGAFAGSIKALKEFNDLGYGSSAEKKINLVYNPLGAFLPPGQRILEQDYKRELWNRFGVVFNDLYVFANMPIGRFKEYLVRSGNLEAYAARLAASFNPSTLEGLMCRFLVNVGWDGTLYDCDFNQALGLAIDPDSSRHIREFDVPRLLRRKISVGEHCHACAAGQGST